MLSDSSGLNKKKLLTHSGKTNICYKVLHIPRDGLQLKLNNAVIYAVVIETILRQKCTT